jgi:hypothetical protein
VHAPGAEAEAAAEERPERSHAEPGGLPLEEESKRDRQERRDGEGVVAGMTGASTGTEAMATPASTRARNIRQGTDVAEKNRTPAAPHPRPAAAAPATNRRHQTPTSTASGGSCRKRRTISARAAATARRKASQATVSPRGASPQLTRASVMAATGVVTSAIPELP